MTALADCRRWWHEPGRPGLIVRWRWTDSLHGSRSRRRKLAAQGINRAKRLAARNGRDLPVVIPRVLALVRSFHLVDTEVIDDAAVGLNLRRHSEALDRQPLHRSRDRIRIVGPR